MVLAMNREVWREYEQAAFDVFRSTGQQCELDVLLKGVRGSHQVDILVSLDLASGKHRWLVECKHWSRRVTKHELQAFKTAIDDVGADHGYLLSEVGFQTGALEMAQTLNVSLTSVARLTERFREEQLMPDCRQSRDFWATVVERHDDLGNFDSETIIELGPVGDLSVLDHIVEVHIIREGIFHWVIPQEDCGKLVQSSGRLRLSLPWDPIRICKVPTETIPTSLVSAAFTGKLESGEWIPGPYRIVFRTLAGPVSISTFVDIYK